MNESVAHAQTHDCGDLTYFRLSDGRLAEFSVGDPESAQLLRQLHRRCRPTTSGVLSLLRHSSIAGRALALLRPADAPEHVLGADLFACVCDFLGEEPSALAMTVSSRRCAAIVAAHLASGETVFVKARVSEPLRLTGQAEFLTAYRDACPESIAIPRVLRLGSVGRWTMLALSDACAPGPAGAEPTLAQVLPYLACMRAGSCVRVGFSEGIERLARSCAASDRATALLRALLPTPPAETIDLAPAHGDFAPWNMAIQDGRLHLWDWDEATFDAPWPYDAIHFCFQSRRHRHGQSPTAAARGTVRDIADNATDLGLSGDTDDRSWLLIPYAACRAASEQRTDGSLGSDTRWLLEYAETLMTGVGTALSARA